MKAKKPPFISFRPDEEAHEALAQLEAAIEPGIPKNRRRSVAIRRALLTAAAILKHQK